jgi:heptosyltransferase-2
LKILVIQQKMIGDVLTSSILFEGLREKYPDAELHYLINSYTYPVVENHPFINEFILFTPEIEKSKLKLLELAQTLRNRHYDIVIDVYSKLSSNIITLFSGAKTKISYYKPYSSFLYNYNIKRQSETNKNCGLAIANRIQLLKPLGIGFKEIKPKIYLTNSEIEVAKILIQSHDIDLNKPLIMISVLGSGLKKTYPFTYMAKVIDQIVTETQCQILFNYIPNQVNDAQAIFEACNLETQKHIYFDVFGDSIRSFLALLSICDAIIGNEGGAINMAKALNIKTFAIFAPWINKETWNIFEEKGVNDAVHLKDYKPELYNSETENDMKSDAQSYYQEFVPDLFSDKLTTFLKALTTYD